MFYTKNLLKIKIDEFRTKMSKKYAESRTQNQYKKLYKKLQYKKCCLTWLKVNTIIKITEFRTKKEYKIC